MQRSRCDRSGYYAWDKCLESESKKNDKVLLEQIKAVYIKSRRSFGGRKITVAINRLDRKVNHKKVERLMREAKIRSKMSRKYKATTDSGHNLPVRENLLNREFNTDRPNQKWVSDITSLWTDEGWLYIAGVLDLCGRKMIGLSMDSKDEKRACHKSFGCSQAKGEQAAGRTCSL